MATQAPQAASCLTLAFTWLLFAVGDGRQMCYTCQYVLNGPGIECVTAPLNWTGGEPRMRCPGDCTIVAEYDANTLKPTYFYRGCTVQTSNQEDGCVRGGARYSCFFSCGGGKNYCNDKSLPRAPVPHKDKDGNNGGCHFNPWQFPFLVLIFWFAFRLIC